MSSHASFGAPRRAAAWVLGTLIASAGASAAPPDFHQAVGASAPNLWYKFNEPANATAIINYGSWGSAYNAKPFNGVLLNQASSLGDPAVRFNQATQPYIESDSVVPAALTGNPTFSIEAIVKVEGQGTLWAPFLFWGGNTTGSSAWMSIRASEPDRYFAGFYNSGLRSVCRTSGTAWYHIVWVRDSAGGTRNSLTGSTLYINGEPAQLVRDEVLAGPVTPNLIASKFRIQKAGDFTRFWSGAMDELALYTRALTLDEVQTHALAFGVGATAKFCPADLNADCLVDDSDFQIFARSYDILLCSDPTMPFNCPADLNKDTLVDDQDFGVFVQAYDALLCE